MHLVRSHLCACGCGRETKLSDRTDPKRGVVKGQPLKYLTGHNRTCERKVVLEPVEQDCGYETPCLLWQGAINKTLGYGYLNKQPAHRWYYEQHVGPIPEGMYLDHLCRNKACVNPEHLEPVTNAENCRRGLKAKLTAEDVAAIRRSALSNTALGRRYDVHSAHISRIRNGHVWAAA